MGLEKVILKLSDLPIKGTFKTYDYLSEEHASFWINITRKT